MKLRLPVFLAAASAVFAFAQSPAPALQLGSTVFPFEKLAAKPTGNGQRREVNDSPTATLASFESHVTTLLPGRISHPPHQHLREELIILQEGTLDVTINGATTRAGPGSLLFFASNDFHNVKNVGETPATYFVFNFSTGATASGPKQGAAAAAVPGKLGSRVIEWAKLAGKVTKTGERRDVVDSPTLTMQKFECHVTTLNPHEAPHAPHHHPDEEIVLVKEGALDITMNGTTTRAGVGSIIFAASNEEHGWRNAVDVPATYYVLRIGTERTPPVAAK